MLRLLPARPILFFIIVLLSCKTIYAQKINNAPSASSSPMSCKIKGQIVEILKKTDTGISNAYAQYPCRAKVKIIDISDCGASVSAPLIGGDTVEMFFAYTLIDTKKIFPKMKAHYRGLKKGNVFSAYAEQRLKMGTQGMFTVYHYDVLKHK